MLPFPQSSQPEKGPSPRRCHTCLTAQWIASQKIENKEALDPLTDAMYGIFKWLEEGSKPVSAVEALQKVFIYQHIASIPGDRVEGIYPGYPVVAKDHNIRLYHDLKKAGFGETVDRPIDTLGSDHEMIARHFLGLAMKELKERRPPGEDFAARVSQFLCLDDHERRGLICSL
ncbi:MAG: hypothetical protein IT558_02725 [Alphaproteobacteria bacterium]|nr:hypothetical protein [Alphaproteobacteria bacterium]